jgi:hypothetical protein
MTLSICTGIRLIAIALLAAAPAAWAQPAPASPDAQISPNDVPVGDTTRALLAIQRNGSQAGKMLPLSGEQAALGYGRYLQSFQHPLPAFFTGQASGSPLRGGAGSQPLGGQSNGQ